MTNQSNSPPGVSAAPETQGPTLPADGLPAAHVAMSATPKTRGDLDYVRQALARDQPPAQGEMIEEDYGDGLESAEDAPRRPIAAPEGLAPTRDDAPSSGPPEWFRWPAGYEVPPMRRGARMCFFRFPVDMVECLPQRERQCAVMTLTPKEEKLARARAPGDTAGYETTAELAKQMLRIIDGVPADFFHAGPGNAHRFWNEIGPLARAVLTNYYLQTHVLGREKRDAFLASCMEVRSVG